MGAAGWTPPTLYAIWDMRRVQNPGHVRARFYSPVGVKLGGVKLRLVGLLYGLSVLLYVVTSLSISSVSPLLLLVIFLAPPAVVVTLALLFMSRCRVDA